MTFPVSILFSQLSSRTPVSAWKLLYHTPTPGIMQVVEVEEDPWLGGGGGGRDEPRVVEVFEGCTTLGVLLLEYCWCKLLTYHLCSIFRQSTPSGMFIIKIDVSSIFFKIHSKETKVAIRSSSSSFQAISHIRPPSIMLCLYQVVEEWWVTKKALTENFLGQGKLRMYNQYFDHHCSFLDENGWYTPSLYRSSFNKLGKNDGRRREALK